MNARKRDLLDALFEYSDMGFSCNACKGKQPAMPWKEFTERQPTRAEIHRWVHTGIMENVGLICGRISGVIALDFDTREKLAILDKLPPSDMVTETAKGKHVYFRLPDGLEVRPRVRIGGMQLDVRGECSYCLVPPSIHPSGTPYVRVGGWNLSKVPYFDPAWIQDERKGPGEALKSAGLTGKRLESAKRYVEKIVAREHQNAHGTFYRAVCKTVDLFGIREEEELMSLFRDWSRTNCFDDRGNPYPFSEVEIRHKVRDVLRRK